MSSRKQLIVSHAPFWHNGSGVPERSYHFLLAALPAALMGLATFGAPALAVLSLSVASAIGWEVAFNYVSKRPVTVADGNAAVIGLLFAMVMPATTPWWLVLLGTLLAIVVGKQIFGGIGANPFHPVALAWAILFVSYRPFFDFDGMLVNYNFDFPAAYPIAALKAFGPEAVAELPLLDLLLGRQTGGIGATCGLAIIAGGVYLILRGFIRWEIALSFIGGIFFTALLFHIGDPTRYASPWFHLLTGYTLIGAFFLAPEDSSSPVNFAAMLIYGALMGFMVILIRNIGAFADGVILAILVGNTINPLVDKIRPKALGKVT
ncbi:MAG: RnfABCDGE type electron transport complex subunit D [Desulfosarcinaceae bacterium]|nr:RnfABCDGE type electron transport complex subunit D [Desulfosarcinaceae bacterium]